MFFSFQATEEGILTNDFQVFYKRLMEGKRVETSLF